MYLDFILAEMQNKLSLNWNEICCMIFLWTSVSLILSVIRFIKIT